LDRYRDGIECGATLVVPSVRQLPPVCVDPHIKMRSRMHWYLADREAQRLEPGALALLLDQDGMITETAAANVLFVLEGKVISPLAASVGRRSWHGPARSDPTAKMNVIFPCRRLASQHCLSLYHPSRVY